MEFVQVMSDLLQHHWSQTSQRLMNACPRAWAHSYGQPHRGSPLINNKHPTKNRPLNRPNDLRIRIGRRAMMERFEDLYQSKAWSEDYVHRRLSEILTHECWLHRLQVDQTKQKGMIQAVHGAMESLKRTRVLGPLFRHEPRRWAYFQRFDTVNIGRISLYATPDIAIFHQNKWSLVRIRWASKGEEQSEVLEDTLMLHWALNHPGFPNDVSMFRLRTVTWNKRSWIERAIEINPTQLEASWSLLEHDLQEMSWIRRCIAADPSFDSLPLAQNEQHCRTCKHKQTCPAKNGLFEAKQRRRRKGQ